MLLSVGADTLEVLFQSLDLVADQATVGLELGLARPARADRALHPFEVLPLAGQSGQEVFVLRQGDLDHTLASVGTLSEDVEDQGGAVDDLDLEPLLQRSLLRRCEFVVKDRHCGRELVAQSDDLFEFALADV